jgi:hypothetical protein
MALVASDDVPIHGSHLPRRKPVPESGSGGCFRPQRTAAHALVQSAGSSPVLYRSLERARTSSGR